MKLYYKYVISEDLFKYEDPDNIIKIARENITRGLVEEMLREKLVKFTYDKEPTHYDRIITATIDVVDFREKPKDAGFKADHNKAYEWLSIAQEGLKGTKI